MQCYLAFVMQSRKCVLYSNSFDYGMYYCFGCVHVYVSGIQ